MRSPSTLRMFASTTLASTFRGYPTAAATTRKPAWQALRWIGLLVKPVDQAPYRDFEQLARERMAARDIQDWPVVAVALVLSVPVGTENRDFFGSGMGPSTADRVESYLPN